MQTRSRNLRFRRYAGVDTKDPASQHFGWRLKPSSINRCRRRRPSADAKRSSRQLGQCSSGDCRRGRTTTRPSDFASLPVYYRGRWITGSIRLGLLFSAIVLASATYRLKPPSRGATWPIIAPPLIGVPFSMRGATSSPSQTPPVRQARPETMCEASRHPRLMRSSERSSRLFQRLRPPNRRLAANAHVQAWN